MTKEMKKMSVTFEVCAFEATMLTCLWEVLTEDNVTYWDTLGEYGILVGYIATVAPEVMAYNKDIGLSIPVTPVMQGLADMECARRRTIEAAVIEKRKQNVLRKRRTE